MKWYFWVLIFVGAFWLYAKYKAQQLAISVPAASPTCMLTGQTLNNQGYQIGTVGTSGCDAPTQTIAAGACQPHVGTVPSLPIIGATTRPLPYACTKINLPPFRAPIIGPIFRRTSIATTAR